MASSRRTKRKTTRKDNKTLVECEYKPQLITSLIKSAPEVQTWLTKDEIRIVALKTRTKEYQVHSARFRKTLDPDISYDVLSIERIENPCLMAGFVLKRMELKSMQPKHPVYTRTMFHATKRSATNQIILHNFDWRMSGQKRGDKWGHGISFSPHSDFAAKFTRSYNGVCCMLLCYMLQRRAMIGSRGLEVPDDEYDTTKSKDNKVYVKFDDYTVYPAYRITYRMYTD